MATSIKQNSDLKRINVPLPRFLLDRLDSDAVRLGLSRNQMLTVILRDYYNSIDNAKTVQSMKEVVDRTFTIKDNMDMYELTDEGKHVAEEWKKAFSDK